MKNKITRSRTNRIFGGVASGLSEYLQIDILVIRILFVVSCFFSGIGILLYLIMWIVIPEEPFVSPITNDSEVNSSNKENINFTIPPQYNNNKRTLGVILVVIGALFLSAKFFSFLDFADFFPLIMIGFGIYLLTKVKNVRY